MPSTQFDRRQTVEDCQVLDVDLLAREGSLTPGVRAMAIWKHGTTVIGAAMWRVRGNAMLVSYTLTAQSTAQEAVHQQVLHVIHRPAGFGGERRYFIWPQCAAPVRKLYLP